MFLARVGESVHVGGAAALFALVLVLIEGGRTDRLGSALVALLCGGLVAATWAYAHRRTAVEVANRLDRRLGFDGAFATAWEQDGEQRGGALSELLVLRVAREVPGRAAARAVLPQSWPLLAAPFVVGAILAALSSGEDPELAARREHRERVAVELSDLAGASAQSELSFEEENALRSLARSAAALADETAGGGAGEEQDRAELVGELRSLGENLPAGSDLARRLDELAGRLEAAAGPGTGPAAETQAEGSGGTPLARPGADGTMAARETRPGPAAGVGRKPEAAWVDPGSLPPDLLRILDDWNAAPPGDSRR
ncbi:MAG: hypothetical protein H6831_09765 [Planctomycetes bacterium]|nr:hypothetical protein [Planctomycetota bacterium]